MPPPPPGVPQKRVRGTNALPRVPPPGPPSFKSCTRGTIPSETTLLGVGDRLTDKDILCWLNQELY